MDIPLSTWNIKDAGPDHNDLNFEFNAFSKPISLRMRRNSRLISPNLRIVKRTEDNGEEELSSGINEIENCHYIHSDETTVAALSSCQGNEVVSKILSLFKSLTRNETNLSEWNHLTSKFNSGNPTTQ